MRGFVCLFVAGRAGAAAQSLSKSLPKAKRSRRSPAGGLGINRSCFRLLHVSFDSALFRFGRAVVGPQLVVSDLLDEDRNLPVDQISAIDLYVVSASFCNDSTAAGGQAL